MNMTALPALVADLANSTINATTTTAATTAITMTAAAVTWSQRTARSLTGGGVLPPASLLDHPTNFSLSLQSSYLAVELLFDNCSHYGNDTSFCNSTDTSPVLAAPKFAMWEVVVIVALTSICAVVTVLGNILVLIAFAVERTLRQPSNYFIASLAVTDLLIGMFSMSAYSTYLVLDRWPMPNLLCDLWLALDYTVCLVSQYNVLLITVDRFCSVKIPAKYRNWRTKRKVQIMVVATWVLPSSMFFPIHLGWDTFMGHRYMKEGTCDAQYIKSNPNFNVILIFGYFWSTLVVLLILYAGIYQTAFSLQRKSAAKHHKMQQMVRLGATGVNKVLDTKQSTGFLTVHTLKQPVNNDVSVAFHSTTVTQGGRTTADTNVEATTPGAKNTGDTSNSSGEPDRSSSPEFPSDTEQPTGDGSMPVPAAHHGTKVTNATSGGKKPPTKGGSTGRSPQFVFRDIRQRVTQRQRPRGKTESIVPKLQPPPKPVTERLPRRATNAPTAKLDLIDLTPESPSMPLVRDSQTSRSLPDVDDPADSQPRGGLVLPCVSQPILSTTAALQSILLAKELNDEIRLLFAQRGSDGAVGQRGPQRGGGLPPRPRSADNGAIVVGASGGDGEPPAPVWLPRVPFPVRFDELPSSLLQPFTGHTPLDNANDWRFIDQESLKSPNSSMDGTQTTTTPTNRSSFSSPLPPIKTVTLTSPQGSVKSPPTSPLVKTPPPMVSPTSGRSLPLVMLRPGGKAPPKVSVKPEVSDIGEESTRYDSDQRSTNNPDDPVGLNHVGGSLLEQQRNNSEKIRAFGRRLRNVASRGSSRRRSFSKRQQSRSENRARKALKTITFIMGAFVLCWTPWHICATIEGFYNGYVNVNFYSLSYWLCYLNSPINPFCYALANQQFKKTFIRVLKMDFHRT